MHRVWWSCGLKPHLVRTFKVSKDPLFEKKLCDIVGLYLNPPENAVVFSFDEKSSVQALDRTQPGLPLKRGRAGTMTYDYKRNGTTSLFAALNVASGEVIGNYTPVLMSGSSSSTFSGVTNLRVAIRSHTFGLIGRNSTWTMSLIIAPR